MDQGPAKAVADAEIGGALKDAARDAWVEREYRLGQLSIAEIARQSGLARATIQKRARKNGWVRDLLPAVQAKVKDGLVRDAAPEGALPAEAIDAAAARAVEVVRQHRASLQRLNRIAAHLMESIEQHLNGELDVIPWMRIHDTVPAVLLRVAQTLAKTVPLERVAFSVGAGDPDEGKKEEGPALPDWRMLFERAGIRVPHPASPAPSRGGDQGPDPGTG